MTKFQITPTDKKLATALKLKIDTKTKPVGALGELEAIAYKIGLIQNSLTPTLTKPIIAVFAGDHGIAEDGIVNPFPQEVTAQMVYNFLGGGAAISVFCRLHGIEIKIIDAGVKHDFKPHPELISIKVAAGTKNYLKEPAMSKAECEEAVSKGADLVMLCQREGTNVIGFGEMGIGNTSAASLIMSTLTGIPINECVGNGTGLDNKGHQQKKKILSEVQALHKLNGSELNVLATFGGFEIAMMAGAILRAAELGMVVLIDGFISTAALLVAYTLYPNVLDYCLFAHTSEEKGHKILLNYLKAKPILSLNMRLGEGTGVALAYPIIQSAVSFLNEMASFESAGVSNTE